MGWLIKKSSELKVHEKEDALAVREKEALISLAKSTSEIAQFITGGGLVSLLSGVARSNAVSTMLGGLTSHAGRNGLDARTLKQNATEIVEQIELVFSKFEERLEAKHRGEQRDPEIKDAESEVTAWVKKQKENE